ncbi:MAG: hypothetical protein LN588_02915 [Rickettsia endosymbiont of Bryobia graminum]|nr:hypothetical protein [Rickettsia endosymbiont of Bryobia graminum]
MSRFFNKAFLFLPVSIVIGFPSILIYNAYQYSKHPSKFELSAERLGFNTHQQEALLNIFHIIAGYFEPQALWRDLSAFDKTTNPKEIYTSVIHSLNLANTNQNATNKINLKLLRKNLFKDTDKVEIQDIEAWILYVAQNAFDRKIGQERNELVAKDWMNKHRDEYFQSAKELGLIDEVLPKHQKYDEAWIAGASRIGILARIIHFNKIIRTR